MLVKIAGRYYLKYLSLRFVKSRRDLSAFIRKERRQLLTDAREGRDGEAQAVDKKRETAYSPEILAENLTFVRGTGSGDALLDEPSTDLVRVDRA